MKNNTFVYLISENHYRTDKKHRYYWHSNQSALSYKPLKDRQRNEPQLLSDTDQGQSERNMWKLSLDLGIYREICCSRYVAYRRGAAVFISAWTLSVYKSERIKEWEKSEKQQAPFMRDRGKQTLLIMKGAFIMRKKEGIWWRDPPHGFDCIRMPFGKDRWYIYNEENSIYNSRKNIRECRGAT